MVGSAGYSHHSPANRWAAVAHLRRPWKITCHLPSPSGSSLRVPAPPHSGFFFRLLVSASVLCSCSGHPPFRLALLSLLSVSANLNLQGRDPLPARTALQVPLEADYPGRAFSIEYLGQVGLNDIQGYVCQSQTSIRASSFIWAMSEMVNLRLGSR